MQILDQRYWGGVCGIVSVIHGILLSKNDDNSLDGLSQDELDYNLGESVLNFLRYAKTENQSLADELVEFTRTFGGQHANKTIDLLISECESAIEAIKTGTRGPKAAQGGWGVAMSKDALEAYINWVGARSTEVAHNGIWSQENLSTFRNCVCGVGDIAKRDTKYSGLRHWVYINDSGYMYNWGVKTEMAQTADRPYVGPPTHNYLVHVLKLG
ncbi:hypothetical protein ACJJIF_21485 [Microbulbifer sp. SSSA002]|uniref:hypothetical protein n=1 Tax=unclassified Microbulbifer TaxID=2619833 RepID=UPI004039D422